MKLPLCTAQIAILTMILACPSVLAKYSSIQENIEKEEKEQKVKYSPMETKYFTKLWESALALEQQELF